MKSILLPASILFRLSVAALSLLGSHSAMAVTDTMTANDPGGSTSFNTAGKWSLGLAPSARNDYATSFQLRSPNGAGATYTFAGDSLTLNTGGTLQGKMTTSGILAFTNGTGLFLNGGTILQASFGGVGNNLTIAGTITANASTNTTLASQNNEKLIISGAIGGSGNLTIANGNIQTVRFDAANTLSGTVSVVSSGIQDTTNRLLQLNNLNALQNATLALTGGGGQTDLVSFSAGSGTYNIGALSGATNQALTDTASAAVAISVGSNNASTTYSGVLSGAGSLTKVGNGGSTQTLNGANTYSGGTTVNGGTLTVNGASGLGATSGTLAVNNQNTGAGSATTLNLSTTADTTTGSLSGTVSQTGVTSGTNTATINTGGSGLNFTVNQTTAGTYGGVIAGAGNIAVGSSSTNTLTLAGVNTYSGTTTVSAGKLEIGATGSISNTSQVMVNTGGTLLLSGNNNINNSNANVTLSGGTIATGASSTTQTVGTLTLSATSTIDYGSFTSNTLHFADSHGMAWTGTLNIYDYTSADALYFGNSSSGLGTGQLGQVAFYSDAGTGTGFLGNGAISNTGQVSPVPEPSSVLGALGLLSLAAFRERRRLRSLFGRQDHEDGNAKDGAPESRGLPLVNS